MSRYMDFVGGTYSSQSVNVDCQRCMNFYPELVESGAGKTRVALYPTAGLKSFCTLPESQVPCLFFNTGRLFAAASMLYEIFPDGTFNTIGALGTSSNRVSLSANINQLMCTTGGRMFIYNLTTGALTETTVGLQGPIAMSGFSDGFFVALIDQSSKFQISALEDGTTWNALNIAQISTFPDNVVSMLIDHREVWFFGPKATSVFYDSGNALFPFEPVPGAFIEQGCGARFSPVRLDNSIFWIGQDERGAGIAWRAQGYTPQRVSNHAVEYAWSQYSQISDAVGYPFQDQGHSFWQIMFPSANNNLGATWVYDVATNFWHERAYQRNGVYEAHHSQCHAYAFGKHLVGDWQSGNIYDMSINYSNDAGNPIRRFRRAPHLSAEQQYMRYKNLQVDVEVGLGPEPPLLDGLGKPRGPLMAMRWSDDGAKTWTDERFRDCGQSGQYKTRVRWDKLGRSRDRVFEISYSDPVPCRIADAYLNFEAGVNA